MSAIVTYAGAPPRRQTVGDAKVRVGFDGNEARRSLASMRLRLVATEMAQIHAGLVSNPAFDALSRRLADWAATIVDADRTLREEPMKSP